MANTDAYLVDADEKQKKYGTPTPSRKTLVYLAAEKTKKVKAMRDLTKWTFQDNGEGKPFSKRVKSWVQKKDYAKQHPKLNWRKLASKFRCRIITLKKGDPRHNPHKRWMRYPRRITKLELPSRYEGYMEGFHFLSRHEQAFAERLSG